MSARSELEEFLLVLLWSADQLMVPTLRNLTGSFEGWAYRQGLMRQVRRLEDRELIQREKRAGELVLRLTDQGRIQALGGVQPVERWNRPWDGLWRQLLFDLPARQRKVRTQLWRWLRANRFGFLQNSVWITPDAVGEVADALAEFREDVESFLLMDAKCCRGYTNEAIVRGAWDFDEINKRYQAYLSTGDISAQLLSRLTESPALLPGWLRSDRVAWQHAVSLDPLLPRALWPAGYLGEKAWKLRIRRLQAVRPCVSAHH